MYAKEQVASSYVDQEMLVAKGAGAIGRNLGCALDNVEVRAIILDNPASDECWYVPSLLNIFFGEGDIRREV